jgi:hypothetical protein
MTPRARPALAASPYRPLYQVGDRATASTSAADELRGLGFMLIVLGSLRVLPTVVVGLTYDIELVAAAVMLGVGCFVALGREHPHTTEQASGPASQEGLFRGYAG